MMNSFSESYSWEQQWNRILRLRNRIGKRGMSREESEDCLRYLFQCLWHMKDAVRHDPSIPQGVRESARNFKPRDRGIRLSRDVCIQRKVLRRDESLSDSVFTNDSDHKTLPIKFDFRVVTPNGEKVAMSVVDQAIVAWRRTLIGWGLQLPNQSVMDESSRSLMSTCN